MSESDFTPFERERINVWVVSTLILGGLIAGFIFGRYELSILPEKGYTKELATNLLEESIDETQKNSNKNCVIVDENERPSIGSENAPVVITFFGDYECPFSRNFNLEVLPMLKEDFIDTGEIRFVYMNFPLDIHKKTTSAAHATKCAEEQNKYWEMHYLIFQEQPNWKAMNNHEDMFLKYANLIGINLKAFQDCMASQKYKKAIEEDKQYGSSCGIEKTPGIFINGNFFRNNNGNYKQLKDYLQKTG